MKQILSTCLLLAFGFVLYAQEKAISLEFKKETIRDLSKMMNDFYVFPDVAKKTSAHLSKQLKAGHFDSFTTLEAFASELTKEVQSINKDKHMLIRKIYRAAEKENTIESMFVEHIDRMGYRRNNAGGFKEAKKLNENVGYIDIRSFAHPDVGGAYADSYMKLLSTSDAIIVDLRNNGGGSPRMVQYLCSYFFDKKVHLNSLYFREGDKTEEYWTVDVKGKKMPDIPLFVLTSDRTFSGAEEFSYNMQTQKRATLVGQVTRGGANPGGLRWINNKLEVFIPTGKAINPITKTNWEGVGVTPDVETTFKEAYVKAYELAKIAAKEYREKVKESQKKLSLELIKIFENFDPKTDNEAVYKKLKECEKAELVNEGIINMLGYEYLMKYKKMEVAEAIFKVNTMMFPEIANVYDSYAEALATNGKLKKSLENYQKAVDIAKATNDPQLELFKKNLQKVKDKMK